MTLIYIQQTIWLNVNLTLILYEPQTFSVLKGKKMSVSTITIRKLLQAVSDGEIRIPAFQRDFVWEPDRVQFLMDSLFKKYPVGTLLLWKTKEKLEHDKMLGPFNLPAPKKDYPIDYVLDGQQRITSIFATFQTELEKDKSFGNWLDIYFDIDAKSDVQDSQFIALEKTDVKKIMSL